MGGGADTLAGGAHAAPGGRPAARPTLPPTSHRPDIQGLRGVAVLLVVAFHATGLVPGGYLGVDVFFVVSGFVITRLLRSESRRPGSIRPTAFFARRVRRLLPMLALTLSATALLGVLLLSPLGASATTSKTAIAAALLNANTFLARQANDYFALPADANALLHTWSLSVEEQFYLVYPFLLLAGLAVLRRVRAGSRRRWAFLALAIAGVASFALDALLLSGRVDGTAGRGGFTSGAALGFYSAPTRAWEFLVGAVLAVALERPVRLPRRCLDVAGVSGLVLVLACALRFDEATGRSAAALAVPVLGTALVLLAGSRPDVPAGPATTALSLRAATGVGDVSYGWYLFHWPLIVFVAANTTSTTWTVAAAAAALGLAVVARRTVEDRFRYDDRWRGRRVVLLGVTCLLVPIVAGAAALGVDHVVRIDQLDRAHLQHLGSTSGCNRRTDPDVRLDDPRCTWTVPGARGRIVLVGDSHADMWSEAVVRAGNALGYDVTLAVMSGCPLVPGTLRLSDGVPDDACRAEVDRTVDELRAAHPDLVVVAAASAGIMRDGGDAWRSTDGSWRTDVDAKARIWTSGLRTAVGGLADAGIRSLVLHDVPTFDRANETCGRLRYLVSPSSCASTATRSDVERYVARSVAVEDAAVDGVTAAATADPVPWICPSGRCSTYVDGTWSYRDADHLSVAGSEALAGRVRDALRTRLG